MNTRLAIKNTKRWIIKVGSTLLTANGKGLDTGAITAWATQIAQLKDRGHDIILVSSGAVAEGMIRLGWKERPRTLSKLQAAAAVGQMGLIQTYESCFQHHGYHTAQVLLGHDDLTARDRYLNIRTTLTTLLALGVIPIINENDPVATDEICFGDNDTLAGLMANLTDADLLVILTDQPGLFDSDPRKNADAKLVESIDIDDKKLADMASGSTSGLGRGGMITKVEAAKLAARSGASTIIAGGDVENILISLADGKWMGTLLTPTQPPEQARQQWLTTLAPIAGKMRLNHAAILALRSSETSLPILPTDVEQISGHFSRGDLIACMDHDGNELARGLTNYHAEAIPTIIKHPETSIEELLGYQGETALISASNLVLASSTQPTQ